MAGQQVEKRDQGWRRNNGEGPRTPHIGSFLGIHDSNQDTVSDTFPQQRPGKVTLGVTWAKKSTKPVFVFPKKGGEKVQ